MNKVLLLVGGNLGDRFSNLENVKALIEEKIGGVVEESSIYESEPWGFEHAQNFYNQVLEVESLYTEYEILDIAQEIERVMGRKAKTKTGYEGRPMDIDILFYNDLVFETERLTIPHPRLHERRFTLMPLAQKWNSLLHPVLNKTMEELLLECKDEGWVRKLN
ncbi:2-amino-4-hydroxy-6-hydroxymethyldihydropteridine diphosphokinase [Plebeiibacterium marinum]|uniref:2-amino-4-hydroxy-6-hydroxymethyldihydropteridine pyrophosphokinase n=1 Tax=Plebeiibacterium marinum TaxID=2992111 RepID=A0AAE3SLA0_9BACT|nr:2-amino-4-hydroxy-6-hydroxymethyldihydropteridine diphosphokinase [Plebeiobacterium marinum]MCW3807383.1 2-amino-4-hydroxy-6-hydroxymethyldihydropteridine diphosphokinase [Plebeiobacterium marinum]